MPPLSPLYVIAGPTASGKTGLAIALARRVAGTVINMDSMQLYRELPILTAQPTAAERAQAQHMLYGVRQASEPANAAWWAEEAKREIVMATAAGAVPILCGGTGLYLQTLLDGIAPIPPVPAEVQAEAAAFIATRGSAALYAQLDPAMQARLQPGDRQRVLRAWAVWQATGRSLADWQALPRVGALTGYAVRILLLQPPRAALYKQCDARFEAMLAAGALDEARALDGQALSAELPLLKACGYAALAQHGRGEMPLDAAIAAAQQATRNYAKRQTTWFKHQLAGRPGVRLHKGFGNESAALEVTADKNRV